MTNTRQKSKFARGKWDKEKSTYMQVIKFQNGRDLAGFSAKIGFHERNDKLALIQNWILRMLRDGYLDRNNTTKDPIEGIEYYEVSTGVHLFTCYYTSVEYISQELIESDYWKPVIRFLDKMYTMVEQKKPVSEIYEKLYTHTRKNSHDPLDIEKKRFLDFGSLKRYALELVDSGRAEPGAVEHFVTKYSEKHFGQTPNVNRGGTNSIKDLLGGKETTTRK